MQTFAMRFLDVDKAKTFCHIDLYLCVFFHHVPATTGLFPLKYHFRFVALWVCVRKTTVCIIKCAVFSCGNATELLWGC